MTFGPGGRCLWEPQGMAGSETASVTVFWADGGPGVSPGFTTWCAGGVPTAEGWLEEYTARSEQLAERAGRPGRGSTSKNV